MKIYALRMLKFETMLCQLVNVIIFSMSRIEEGFLK